MTTPFTPEVIDALADALADRLAQALSGGSVIADVADAATLAARFGVSAQWVRDHAQELGGWRLGDGRKAQYRFDVKTAERALRRRQAADAPAPRIRHPRARRSDSGLLPIRGDDPT